MTHSTTLPAQAETARAPAGFQTLVSAVVRRLGWLALATRLLTVAAGVVLLLWAVLALDALWPMAGGTRRVLGLGILVAVVVGLGWTFWPRRLRRDEVVLHGAACIETELALPCQPLVTAMTLSADATQPDPLAEALRARAVMRADAAAQSASPRGVVSWSLLLRPLCRVWLALVPWLIIAVVFPTLPGIGLARLAQPHADIPPFSLTRFAVGWSPEPVTVGGDARIIATSSGLWPEDVTLVLLDAEDRPMERRALAQAGDDYTLTLRALREPVTFHLEAHGRRTRRYTITPEPDARIESGAADDPSANTPPQDPRTTEPRDPDPGDATPQDGATWALPALLDKLAGLAADLAELSAQAEQSAQGEGLSSQALAEQIASLLEEAEALADALNQATAGAGTDAELSAALSALLGDLAEALRGLSVGELPPGPDSGSTPGDPGNPGASEQWADQAAQAARNDAAQLAEGTGEARNAIQSGLAQRSGGDETGPFRDPAATGGYDEQLGSDGDGVLPDALMQQVPPTYRDQTAAYFRRLAEDRRTPEDAP